MRLREENIPTYHNPRTREKRAAAGVDAGLNEENYFAFAFRKSTVFCREATSAK